MIYKQKQIKIGNIPTSEIEIRDILKSWIAISIAFGILMGRMLDISLYYSFIISALTVGVGFIFHELAHKLVAQRYGCFAEFRASNFMLLFAIFLALFFGFVFAAPGAVMISGPVGKRRNGMISIAGPTTNIILALLFFLLLNLTTFTPLRIIGVIGFYVNSLIAMFNLLPFGNFDGKKVLNWNKSVFFLTFAISIILFFFSQQFVF